MASFSDEATTVADFPFSDLRSFKDYVGFVKLCAPDMFPQREWAPPNEQWDLVRAFDGLRYGLGQTIDEVDERHKPVFELGLQLVEEAAKRYQEGDIRGGFATLQRLQDTLDAISSQ